MKFYYYYLRDRGNRPIVTICLGEDKGKVARGMSVCSLEDSPQKSVGRRIARSKVLKALGTKSSSDPCKRAKCFNAIRQIPDWVVPALKSTYNPVLTKFEKKILDQNI